MLRVAASSKVVSGRMRTSAEVVTGSRVSAARSTV